MSEPLNSYYEPCVKSYQSVANRAAVAEWFESTEPGEQPKHTTILNTTKAEAIMSAFITRLKTDVLKNAILGWKVRGPIFPRKEGYKQPLADPGEGIPGSVNEDDEDDEDGEETGSW